MLRELLHRHAARCDKARPGAEATSDRRLIAAIALSKVGAGNATDTDQVIHRRVLRFEVHGQLKTLGEYLTQQREPAPVDDQIVGIAYERDRRAVCRRDENVEPPGI